jgi:hypothetical protein
MCRSALPESTRGPYFGADILIIVFYVQALSCAE